MSSPPSGPAVLSIYEQALVDLGAWRVRVLARTFYPDVAAAAASVTLPDSLQSLMTLDLDQTPHHQKIRKAIPLVRDIGAALAAAAVQGQPPPYDSYLQFCFQVEELAKVLRAIDVVHSLATQPLAVKAMMPPVAPAARSVETPLQKLLREKTGGAV